MTTDEPTAAEWEEWERRCSSPVNPWGGENANALLRTLRWAKAQQQRMAQVAASIEDVYDFLHECGEEEVHATLSQWRFMLAGSLDFWKSREEAYAQAVAHANSMATRLGEARCEAGEQRARAERAEARVRELEALLREAHEARVVRESGSYGDLCERIERALEDRDA